ncbi:amidohydrolase family protein [Paenibacillus eucommiae]|uniref:TIM-barrel fold metal-dependent hydrolase n=1 Tax=Paenibacillus eucommiae TaxID=1355755 RepID=A0ABS4JAK0_9BACL|nr:amidohydrolase family protein [Paenibacillus eucommiae]MBP1996874.1 putative TIM-barrel fold metal-dependent hydrolase [Paenibacillus eucommiae]
MIDAHIHLDGSKLHAETLSEGDRLGVRLFVGSSICNYIPYPTYEQVSRSNDDMAAVVQAHPDRVAGYCYVNPRHGEKALTDFRRRIEGRTMIGLKLWIATLCNDPLVFPFIEQSIAYKLPILIHSWRKTVGQLPYESTAEHVADLAERYPEARIIMAHMGGQVETAMNTIAAYNNVYTDTSGSPIGGNEVALAVDRLGPERVIFGSDLGGACLASNLGKVLGAGLSPEAVGLVTQGNMSRLLSEVLK